MIADLPPAMQERVICSIASALKYQIPANLMLAIAELENGKPGMRRSNSNGSYDVGTLQFNTTYLKDLHPYGITASDVAQSGCYPYELAAWRLRNHLRHDQGDLWTKAANYHSRTPRYNAQYRLKLKRSAGRWAHWLAERVAVAHYQPEPRGRTNSASFIKYK
jgi:hypothetical protein